MTLDEGFTELGLSDPDRLAEAMQCVLDDWEQAAPRCRALLRGVVAGADHAEATERALHPILHILAERQDTASFDDICALIAEPERADLILGEAILDTLPCILIDCFAGDPAPLQAVIDRPDGDPLVREGSLLAMGYLAQSKRLPRTLMHAYLVDLHDRIPVEPEMPVWLGWVRVVALLGFKALYGQANAVFERGLIARDLMQLDDFRTDARLAQEDPASLAGFLEIGIGPLGSAVAALTEEDADGAPIDAPFVNPLRDVGRNDPCPCGSGKKFKKCCLA